MHQTIRAASSVSDSDVSAAFRQHIDALERDLKHQRFCAAKWPAPVLTARVEIAEATLAHSRAAWEQHEALVALRAKIAAAAQIGAPA
jgi:hypothetical protein